jgi:hypothetical protein
MDGSIEVATIDFIQFNPREHTLLNIEIVTYCIVVDGVPSTTVLRVCSSVVWSVLYCVASTYSVG